MWRGAALAAVCLTAPVVAAATAGPPVFGDFQPFRVGATGGAGAGATTFSGIASTDVNSDGRADLLITQMLDQPPGHNGLVVFLNTTAANATAPSFSGPTFFDTPDDTSVVAAADINTDGKPDAIVGSANGGGVLLNTTAANATAPSFGGPTAFAGAAPVAGFGGSILTPDLNADGRPDFVFPGPGINDGNDVVAVVLNKTPQGASTPLFSAVTYFDSANKNAGVFGRATGDMNGDGKPDILVANSGTTDGAGGTSILTNTTAANAATPSFAGPANFDSGVAPLGIAAIDINGDGRLDVGTGDSAPVLGNGISWRINTTPAGAPAPTFGPVTSFTLPTGIATTIRGADFSGDGKTDVISDFFLPFNRGFSVQLSTTPTDAATAAFAPAVHLADSFIVNTSFVVADVNGDGKPDVARTAFITDPAGSFTTPSAVGVHMNRSVPIPQPSPDNVIFAPQPLGTTSAAQTVTVTNAGGWTMSASRALTGDSADFAVTSDTCSNATVVIDTSCALQVVFTPTATGERKATLTIDPGAGGSPEDVHLYGTSPAASASGSPLQPVADSLQQAVVDRTAPTCKLTGVKSRYTPKTFARKGITATVACNEPSALVSQLVVRVQSIHGQAHAARVGELVLGETATRRAGGTRKVTVKPSRKLVGRLGRKFTLSLVIAATDASQNTRKVTKSIRIR